MHLLYKKRQKNTSQPGIFFTDGERRGQARFSLEHPAYNLLLHNAPFDKDYKNYFHWHWELVPLINGTGGFELGTHTYINPIPPEEAIEVLRKI
jgi:galactose-1-phosphate uridylyltransferase